MKRNGVVGAMAQGRRLLLSLLDISSGILVLHFQFCFSGSAFLVLLLVLFFGFALLVPAFFVLT